MKGFSIIFFFFYCVLPLTLSAQKDTMNNTRPSTPLILYYSHDLSTMSKHDIAAKSYDKIWDYGFTIGINVRPCISRRFSARVGLNYIRNKAYYYPVFEPQVYVSEKKQYGDVEQISLKALQIPFLLEYNLFSNKKRWIGYVIVGMTTNFKLLETLTVRLPDGTIGIVENKSTPTNPLNPWNRRTLFNSHEIWGGCGVNYKFNDYFMITFEPIIKIGNRQNLDLVCYFGIGTNIIYNF